MTSGRKTMAESKPLEQQPIQKAPQTQTKAPQMPAKTGEKEKAAPVKSEKVGAYKAEQAMEGEFAGKEEEQQQQPEVVGAFKAQENEEDGNIEKSPGYTNLDWGNEDNVSDWLVGMFSGRLQDWFIANMKWVGYYADKGWNAGEKWFNKKMEKEKLGKDNKDMPKDKEPEKDKPKDKDKEKPQEKPKDREKPKDKEKPKEKPKDKDKSKEKKKPSQEKAEKAKANLDLAKKNASKRTYEDSALGKNQQAYDQMLIGSLEREVAYHQKVSENPGYAKTKEGRKAKAELISDRKTLTAMRKETGVNNKIVDGRSNKDKTKKAAPRAKVSLKSAGAKAKDNKTKIKNKTKQAQQKGKKKEGQKNKLKGLSKIKNQMRSMFKSKTRTQTRQQQSNRAAVLANKNKKSR